MINLCKHYLQGGGGKINPANPNSVILNEVKNLKTSRRENSSFKKILNSSFFILHLLALTACNNEEAFEADNANKLSINVGVNQPYSRALITGETLPDGDAGAIGIMLSDGDNSITDYDAYTNVKFTGATADGKQKWTGASEVLLTENPSTLYAYYPWKEGTNLSAIAIETGTQTDYLYATPVTGIKETKASADVVMNHVLTNINLSFADGSYAGAGNITSVSVSGDGIATGGTFNAAQETPGFVADSYTGVGTPITSTTATTLGGNAIDIMVVSTDAEKPITISATIDGTEYTATTTAVELAKGNSYQYTLTLNSTFMSVGTVAVATWQPQVKDNLTLEKPISWDNIADGVYAVAADGSPATTADASCIGVALIQGEHRFMIEKNETANAAYGGTTFYWGDNLYGKDVSGITNNSKVDGTNSNGYLPEANGSYVGTPNLSGDYTVWTAGALSEFDGKANTVAIIAAYTEHSVSMDSRDMCSVLNTFNAASDQNQGYDDWYVPACGQLALMYLNMTAINEALTVIGGIAISAGFYWSSSEYSGSRAWSVGFNSGYGGNGGKDDDDRVRFVRDI